MGLTEIALIMFVALILFGPEDLPVIARALGKTVFQVRKFVNEISREFQEAIDTPTNVINEVLKDTPSKEKLPKAEDKAKDTEELLSYEDKREEVSADVSAKETNPLAELPSDIVSAPKDTQAGE